MEIHNGRYNLDRRIIAVLLGLLVIFSSMASGLSIRNTAGGNLGSSSLGATYGATTQDSVDHQVKLNPSLGTASNRYVGTGNLPYSYAWISDSSGNWAYADRQINAPSGLGWWYYDWGTYRPSGGVGAWLSMDVHNANSITGGSSAGNVHGDYATTYTSISDSNNRAFLSNYWTQSEAYPAYAWSTNNANIASGNSVAFAGYSGDAYGDTSYSNQIACGDSSGNNGFIVKPYEYAVGSTPYGYTYAYESQYASIGAGTQMYTTSTDKSLMEGHNAYYESGGVESGIRRYNWKWLGGALYSYATPNNVYTGASINDQAWYKNALYLDPYRAEWKNTYGDTGAYVVNTLMNKEYLATRYWDSAVTRSRVAEMANTPYSVINTHANTDGFEITRYYAEDGSGNLNNRWISASDIYSDYANGNGANLMTILSGCETSKPKSDGSRPLMNALSSSGKSYSFGGYDYPVYIITNAQFLKNFFDNLAAGQDAVTANTNAGNSVGGGQYLTLYHNTYLYN